MAVPVQIFWSFFYWFLIFLLIHRNYIYFSVSVLCVAGIFIHSDLPFHSCQTRFVRLFYKTEVKKVLAKQTFNIIEVTTFLFFTVRVFGLFREVFTSHKDNILCYLPKASLAFHFEVYEPFSKCTVFLHVGSAAGPNNWSWLLTLLHVPCPLLSAQCLKLTHLP